jgi:hypothetical protein
MKHLLREIEGEGVQNPRKRMLSFKEFCEYVYDPLRRVDALNLSEEDEEELKRSIRRRTWSFRN